MNRLRIILSVLICLNIFSLSAQRNQYTTRNRKAIKSYEQGLEYFSTTHRNFEKGFEYLENATKIAPEFAEAHLRLAKEYKMFRKTDLIVDHYQKVIEYYPDSRGYLGVYINLGQIYMEAGEYEKAKPLYEKVLTFDDINPKLITKAQHEVDRIDFAIEAKANPMDVNPVKMNERINAHQFNSNPVLVANNSMMIYSIKDGLSKRAHEDIVYSNKVNGEWTLPKSISDQINSEYTSEGFASISGDGKTLVFAAADRKDCIGSVDIYISYREGNKWSLPENMGKWVNSHAWDSEPTISADGNTVYFSSDRKGGFGLRDLYVTRRKPNGEWSEPVNMGEAVNTSGNEVTPFIHASNELLLYATDGGIGLGGYDVFFSTRENNEPWNEGENIGYPLNSEDNEGAVFLTADLAKGYYEKYFSAEQNQLPHSYIFEFDLPDDFMQGKKCIYAEGIVTDKTTGKPLKAKIELVRLVDQETDQLVYSDKVNGDYLVVLKEGREYGLYVSAEGYLFHSNYFNFKDEENFDPLNLNVELIPLSEKQSIVLPNVFFESGSYTLDKKSYSELNRVVDLLKNEDIKIEIGGHTDNVGSDTDNLKLSLQRANAVKEYLIAQDINSDRVSIKGYGDKQPIAPNKSEAGRAQNRRIELKIL